MSLFGGITDMLFGKPEAPEADFETIVELMRLGDLYSNPNQRGMFSGWESEIDPETGRLTQTQTMNPEIQPAFDQFLGRLNQGPGDEQLNTLRDAALEARMGQFGPRPMPERRQRPKRRSEYTDEEGNFIRPPDWWHRRG